MAQSEPFHVIGDSDTILGFQFAGVRGTPVKTAEEARKAFHSVLERRSVQILVVTETVAQNLSGELTEHRAQAEPPYVVEIPDIWDTEVKRQSLESMIQEAVGIRIVKE